MRARSWLRLLVPLVLTLTVCAAIRWDWTDKLRGPAPIPDEWQWTLDVREDWAKAIPAASIGVGLAVLLWLAGTLLRNRGTWCGRGLVLLGVVGAFALQVAYLEMEGPGATITTFTRTQSPSANSYYAAAASPYGEDPLTFVRDHAALLRELREDHHHASTHPPGGVLFYRGVYALCRQFPSLTDATLDLIAKEGLPDARSHPDERVHAWAATAFLGAWLVMLACALTCFPIAGLARSLGASPMEAARVGMLWGLVPGPALMSPQLDQAVALLTTACAAAVFTAMHAPTAAVRGRRAALAGAWCGVAVFVSYGAAAFCLVGAAAAVVACWHRPRALVASVHVTIVAAGVAAVLFFLPALLGGEPWRALRTALDIHREHYTAPRDHRTWMLFNLTDLALFTGVPIACLAVAGAVASAGAALRRRADGGARFTLVVAAGILALDVSGAVRGEVGRIWIPLMALILPAAFARGDRRASVMAGIAVLLSLQGVVIRMTWYVP